MAVSAGTAWFDPRPFVALDAPLPALAREQWLRELDPLDDLAPWVPEGEPFGSGGFRGSGLTRAQIGGISATIMPPYKAEILHGERTLHQPRSALENNPPVVAAAPARDRRITVHPDAIRHANDDLGCVFTVEYTNGDHRTFRVSRPKPKGNAPPAAFLDRPLFGSVLVGSSPDSPYCYAYIGVVTWPRLRVKLTAGSRGVAVAQNWPLLDDALGAIRDGVRGDGIASIENSGQCSRCGRPLTNPVSLALGIGPECREKE